MYSNTHTHIDIYTQTHRHTGTQTHRHKDTQTHRYTDTQIHIYTDTHTQTHRHTDTQIHRYTDTQTHARSYGVKILAITATNTLANPMLTRTKAPLVSKGLSVAAVGADLSEPVAVQNSQVAGESCLILS